MKNNHWKLYLHKNLHMDIYSSCWHKTNRLPVISPSKMGLFEISKELQFRVCNQVDHVQVLSKKWRELFYREEEEVERAIVNQESSTYHWLSSSQARKGRLPLVLCYLHRARAPPSGLPTLFFYNFILIRGLFLKCNFYLFLPHKSIAGLCNMKKILK